MKEVLTWISAIVWMGGIMAAVVLMLCGFDPLPSSLIAVAGLVVGKICLAVSNLKEKP